MSDLGIKVGMDLMIAPAYLNQDAVGIGRLAGSDLLMTKDIDSCDWIRVKYKRNRGILYDGDSPHMATKIDSISPLKRRVILGFNCFTDIVSECNQRAPEHSDAFNRTIKLYQAVKGVDGNDDVVSKRSRITAADVLKNPELAKLMVAAAKRMKSLAKDSSG